VTEVHDLHIWAMGTNETALTAHLFVQAATRIRFSTVSVRSCHTVFNIQHATLQVEAGSDVCKLAPSEVV